METPVIWDAIELDIIFINSVLTRRRAGISFFIGNVNGDRNSGIDSKVDVLKSDNDYETTE